VAVYTLTMHIDDVVDGIVIQVSTSIYIKYWNKKGKATLANLP